jgi:hypothetical protein
MAVTIAALRRDDHLLVSAGGKPDKRRFLFRSAVMGSFEDIDPAYDSLPDHFIPPFPLIISAGSPGPGF